MPLAQHSCIILAGGFGTRLKSVVNDRPKVLALVNGQPFLHHLIGQVAAAGIKHIVLSTGFMADLVEQTFGAEYSGVKIDYACEKEALGTGGATRLAFEQCGPGAVLVMNGDSYSGVDLGDFFDSHTQRRGRGSLALTRVPDVSRYGSVTLRPNGAIQDFLEKNAASGSGLVNAGVYWLEPDLIRSINSGRPVSLERDVFPKSDGMLFGYEFHGAFIDIGTPESYLDASKVLAGKAL
jgi:D-glycero-alpha-D-manno-heptose 1-phosphate guanylyltransferase